MVKKTISTILNLLTWLALAGCLWLYATPALADGEQLYFVGMAAPIGSISQPGSTTNGVYLRWDVQEGQLPADIGRFILKRDNGTNIVEIFNEPADAVMSGAEINALYAGPEQDRRRKEMMRRLDNPSNLGAAIRYKLTSSTGTDIYWRFLASRIDFNVARARYLGYLDTTATGSNAYELFAQSNEAPFTQKLVGKVAVNALATQVLPAASNFDDVQEFSRCDAPSERFKEHGTVALNWGFPGASAADRYVAAIVTGGYDLYRTTEDIDPDIFPTTPPPRHLRDEAENLNHDTLGEVSFPGLEKVNQEPIVISGSSDKEATREGWNPDFAQFLETRKDLLAQRIKPGDTRGYYLVARDFTGNYGNTVGATVTVPDAVAPPPPWAVRAINEVNDPDDTADDVFKLSWDQVDVLNFYQRHKMGRTYCNLNTARFDREVRYVPEGENCDDFPHFVVDLDIKEYIVYRFDDVKTAGDFSDSDGDGYSNKAERKPLNPPIPNQTDTGTACDPTEPPPNPPPPDPPFTDYRAGLPVATSSAVVRSSGRRVLFFEDVIPAQAKGNVFWYRIASRDQENNLSTLSEPIRAFFPDRTRPSRDDLVVEIGEPTCDYSVVVHNPVAELPFALDSSLDATHVKASCMRDGGTVPIPFEKTWEITTLGLGKRGVELSSEDCQLLMDFCYDRALTVTYLANGQTLASAEAGAMTSCPTEPKTELVKECFCGPDGFRPLSRGAVIEGPICFNVEVPPGHCLNIYRDIGGRSYHYETLCYPVSLPIQLDVAALGGSEVSLSLALQNENNVVASKWRVPYFTIWATDPPNPPQPIVMKFTPESNLAQLSWLPPEQPVVGTIVEWYWKGAGPAPPQTAFSSFFPHAGNSANDGTINVDVNITNEQSGTDWEELWCFRGRSVGKAKNGSSDGVLSDWSALRCDIRLPAGEELPDYIPWPKIEVPPKLTGDDLLARYLPLDQVPVVLLSNEIGILVHDCANIIECNPEKDLCLPAYNDEVTCPPFVNFCSTLRDSVAGRLGFVAYRQTADDEGTAGTYSDYIQISPLITTFSSCFRDFGPPVVEEFDDAYLFLIDFDTPGDPDWDGPRMVFVDNAPHIEDRSYRYQFVYFDTLGEITGYRQTTDWIQAQ